MLFQLITWVLVVDWAFVFAGSMSNNAANIKWVQEADPVGQSTHGRKPNPVWDHFSRHKLVPYYEDTELLVPSDIAKPKPKGTCKYCAKEGISGHNISLEILLYLLQTANYMPK
eukprot:525321_1